MKKIILPVLIIAFLLSAFSVVYRRMHNTVKSVPQTKIRFSAKLINIGDKMLNSPTEGKFIVHNIGSNDLFIKKVEPDCHCTGAIFSKEAVKPNDSAQIILKYNSSIPGYFQSSALVTMNTPDSALVLIFRGNVIDTDDQK